MVHGQAQGGDVLGDVLVDHRLGEPGQRELVAVGLGGDLGPGEGPAQRLDGARGEVLLAAHARTPTRTLRNRAGAAGWPVWPV